MVTTVRRRPRAASWEAKSRSGSAWPCAEKGTTRTCGPGPGRKIDLGGSLLLLLLEMDLGSGRVRVGSRASPVTTLFILLLELNLSNQTPLVITTINHTIQLTSTVK